MIIKNKPVLIYSITALIGCLFLNIGVFKDYAFLDAHEFIWTAGEDPNFKNLFIQGGRFLYGLTSEFVYGPFCNTISDLKWVRLFSLLGCVVFSVQIFFFLLKLKMKIYESALFSFLILTIPSFSVFYSWSATYEIPVVLNLSFLAGIILLKNLDQKKIKILNYLVALLFVIVSLCLYQSAATAFLIPIVFSFVLNKDFSIRKVVHFLIFLGLSFSIYFVIFKLSLFWYELEPINRTKIDLIRLPFKVIIFYLKEMRMLLYGSGLLIWPILFLVIGSFSFLGFFYSYYQRKSKTPQFFLFISFLLLVLPLSYLPNLLSEDNYVCSRTIAPAAILVLFYQFVFLRQLSIKYKLLKYTSLLIGLILIIFSSINLNFYITKIHNKEYTALKTAFNKVPINNTKRIILVRPKNDFLQSFKYYEREYADEFGHISSSRVWVPEPLFNQILKERLDSLGLDKNIIFNTKIEVYDFDDKFNDENSIIINIIDILKNEFNHK